MKKGRTVIKVVTTFALAVGFACVSVTPVYAVDPPPVEIDMIVEVLAGVSELGIDSASGGQSLDITLPGGTSLALGAILECVTPHCDPTVNLYDQYHCVRDDVLVDIWSVDARGRY